MAIVLGGRDKGICIGGHRRRKVVGTGLFTALASDCWRLCHDQWCGWPNCAVECQPPEGITWCHGEIAVITGGRAANLVMVGEEVQQHFQLRIEKM